MPKTASSILVGAALFTAGMVIGAAAGREEAPGLDECRAALQVAIHAMTRAETALTLYDLNIHPEQPVVTFVATAEGEDR